MGRIQFECRLGRPTDTAEVVSLGPNRSLRKDRAVLPCRESGSVFVLVILLYPFGKGLSSANALFLLTGGPYHCQWLL